MICSLASAPHVRGQTASEVLTFLVTNQSVETGSIERDRAAAEATSATISRALLAHLATLPVTTSSGGFLYRLNPELGTVERATQTFGPFFIERALTAGRGSVSAGMTVQHFRFDSLDGENLRDGSLVTLANQFVDEADPFDVDRLTLNIDADIATFYGNVGITDRLEAGFAIPVAWLRIDGTRVNTYRDRTFTQARASSKVIGFTDALARVKYTVWSEDGAGVAGALDVRLPTGREENLLGTGTTSYRMVGVGSLERGVLSAHANVSFTTGGLADEASWGAAIAVAAAPRLTLTTEVLHRWVDSPGHIELASAAHPGLRGVTTSRLVPDETAELSVITLTPGFKWNLTDTWVFVASAGVPLTTRGLTAPLTPFVGFDYALGQ
jgi:hypothetical protein